MQSTHDFSVQAENYTISAALFTIGPDILIIITGGDHPHIGDVTTKSPTTDLQTIQYPSHDGRFHKDYFLSERLAPQIKPTVKGSLTILAGVHVDHITQAQLNASSDMIDQLAAQINNWLADHPVTISKPKYYHHDEQPK